MLTHSQKEDILSLYEQKKDRSFYFHDLLVLERQIEKLKTAFRQNVSFYYAMKANPAESILRFIREKGYIKGIEVASKGELCLALKYFSPEQIIFTGPGKSDLDLEYAVKNRIGQIHIESLTEAHRLNHFVKEIIGKPLRVLIRVNMRSKIDSLFNSYTGQPSKFGIDEESLIDNGIKKFKELEFLNIVGLHAFPGSGILDADKLIEYTKQVMALAAKLNSLATMEVIDLGGGFGLDYEQVGKSLDLIEVSKNIDHLLSTNAFCKKIIFELGRYLIGESGYYVTPIIDIKSSRGKKFIITLGGINHQRRPMAYGVNHPVDIIHRNVEPLFAGQEKVYQEKVDIGGPLCTGSDFLAKDQFIAEACVGDLLIIGLSGAYGASVSPQEFLCHPKPIQYYR